MLARWFTILALFAVLILAGCGGSGGSSKSLGGGATDVGSGEVPVGGGDAGTADPVP